MLLVALGVLGLVVLTEIALVIGACVVAARGARLGLGLLAAMVGGGHASWVAWTTWDLELLFGVSPWFFASLAAAATATTVGVFAIALHRLEHRTYVRAMLVVVGSASVIAGLVIVRELDARDAWRHVPAAPVVEVQDLCARHEDGRVSCLMDPAEPWLAVVDVTDARSLSPGASRVHGCVTDSRGRLWCWRGGSGSNTRPTAILAAEGVAFIAGVDELTRGASPAFRVVFVSLQGRAMVQDHLGIREVHADLPTYDALAFRDGRGCGVQTNGGSVTCWWFPEAQHQGGKLSIGEPMPTSGTSSGLALTTNGGCVLSEEGSVGCWNEMSALGEQGISAVAGVEQVVQIVAGSTHTCALERNGTVRCWGGNSLGQLGIGDREARDGPRKASVGQPVLQLSASDEKACAVTEANAVLCWGRVYGWMIEDPGRVQRCRRSKLFGDTWCIPTPSGLRWLGSGVQR